MHKISLFLLCFFSVVVNNLASSQLVIPAPPGSAAFGSAVAVLPNGNIVVTDPGYDQVSPTPIVDVGAIYLFKGTGEQISMITGSKAQDRIGNGGIIVFPSGNYIVRSQNWDNGSTVDAGAITFGSAISGATGVVGAANSLIGSSTNDHIGSGNFIRLTNGTYVVIHGAWNSSRGAVTWLDPSAGTLGVVSEQNSLVGSASGDRIGMINNTPGITELPTGKFVVTSINWGGSKGAVTLCAQGSCAAAVSAANSVVGASSSDFAGTGGIFPLPNGNFVVASPNFDNNGVFNSGAATFVNGATGAGLVISASNSLVGTNFNDLVANGEGGIVVLANGNYVVRAPGWNGGRGASTFASGTAGITGEVSAANSLVGNSTSDGFLSNVVGLTNGNYVVVSPSWSSGTPGVNSAATFANGTMGMTGTITAGNSFIHGIDFVLPLPNGNYVIRGFSGVTLANGTTGLTGSPSPAVSLMTGTGSASVTILPNSDYIVVNSDWGNGKTFEAGAVAYGSGTTGLTGDMGPANSMIGTHNNDEIGSEGVVVLSNGNYVIRSRNWNSDSGAATFVNVSAGTVGTVSAENSVVGTPSNPVLDLVTPLTNGNYVLSSEFWNGNTGEAMFASGINGAHGEISSANALVGSSTTDRVAANGGVFALSNGNYIVVSRQWNGARGAITWGSGTAGVSGVLSTSNSLVGSTANDNLGINGINVLPNGNILLRTAGWDNGAANDAGAVTLINGATGVAGPVSSANSLVGSIPADNVGIGQPVFYPDGSFAFVNSNWDNQAVTNAGEVTFSFGNDFLAGTPGFGSSVKGNVSGGGATMTFHYEPAANTVAVGYPAANRVTLLRKSSPFDFDRDGKADLAVYRPAFGHWFYQHSTNNTVAGFNFGTGGDKITPADFTGDGKTDIAVYRPSEGNWYVLRSDDGTIYGSTFGLAADIPAPGDFDGDGRSDITVFRPSDGNWYSLPSSGGFSITHFGQAGDVPVVGDYDADGRSDIGIFRANAKSGNGEWWIQRSTAGIFVTVFGNNTDIPIVADYSGDGTTDVAFRRPSDGWWYVLQMEDFNFFAAPFGSGTDTPVPGDYDGDGKADFAVFRPSDSAWFIARTASGIFIQQFGSVGDKPVPSAYIP